MQLNVEEKKRYPHWDSNPIPSAYQSRLITFIQTKVSHLHIYTIIIIAMCNATDNLLADSYYDISQMLDNNANAQNSHSLNRGHKTVRATIILGRHYNYTVTVHKQLLQNINN